MPWCNNRFQLISIFLLLVSFSQAATDKYRCMWRDDPTTTMVIGWNQLSGNNPILYYSTIDHGDASEAYPYQQGPDRIKDARGMRNHFVRLRDLQPGTTYYFVIKDSEGQSRRMSFRTAPDDPYERLSIIAGGDSRNFRAARQKANQLVAKLRPHFVLFGGDMTGGDNAAQWKNWMDDWQETITADARLTPVVVTRGNHEYSNQTLVDLFDLAQANAYYTLSVGGNLLRIYTLNSLIASGGAQKEWLAKDLQEHSKNYIWKVAQYHYAIRPHTARKTERNDQLKNWAGLFHEHQVNLVVESDAHVVKWTYPVRPSREKGSDEGFIRDDATGTVYVGEGCWGAPLRRNNDDKNWTRNSGSFNQFKWIFVDMDRMEVRTIKTDNAADVAAVNPDDIFSPPAGLDIWQPKNGSTVVINRNYGMLASQTSSANAGSSRNRIVNFSAAIDTPHVAISWMVENEPQKASTFEVQRLGPDGKSYATIASLEGNGKGDHFYQIKDSQYDAKSATLSYRLKEITPNGNIKTYNPRQVDLRSLAWASFDQLSPDQVSGMLRAQYALRRTADIKIRLIDVTDKVIAWADYKNHKAGNYLKSIDMRRFPTGRYLLTISASEEVLKQFLVVK